MGPSGSNVNRNDINLVSSKNPTEEKPVNPDVKGSNYAKKRLLVESHQASDDHQPLQLNQRKISKLKTLTTKVTNFIKENKLNILGIALIALGASVIIIASIFVVATPLSLAIFCGVLLPLAGLAIGAGMSMFTLFDIANNKNDDDSKAKKEQNPASDAVAAQLEIQEQNKKNKEQEDEHLKIMNEHKNGINNNYAT